MSSQLTVISHKPILFYSEFFAINYLHTKSVESKSANVNGKPISAKYKTALETANQEIEKIILGK